LLLLRASYKLGSLARKSIELFLFLNCVSLSIRGFLRCVGFGGSEVFDLSGGGFPTVRFVLALLREVGEGFVEYGGGKFSGFARGFIVCGLLVWFFSKSLDLFFAFPY
jgi:hypothetical protein